MNLQKLRIVGPLTQFQRLVVSCDLASGLMGIDWGILALFIKDRQSSSAIDAVPRMAEYAEELWDLMQDEKTHVYMCGLKGASAGKDGKDGTVIVIGLRRSTSLVSNYALKLPHSHAPLTHCDETPHPSHVQTSQAWRAAWRSASAPLPRRTASCGLSSPKP